MEKKAKEKGSQRGNCRSYDICAYKGCTNGKFTTRLYRFPKITDPRLAVWIENAGDLRLKWLASSSLRCNGLCGDHFEPNCFVDDKRTLSRTAIPKKFDRTRKISAEASNANHLNVAEKPRTSSTALKEAEESRATFKRFPAGVLVDEEANLFNASLLDRLPNQRHENGLLVRPLRSTDYDKGFIQLLGQLTEVGNISKEQFLSRFLKMKHAGGYYIVVVEDLDSGKVVGSASLIVEQKFIHNCSLRGRLEDVVVNSNYRGRQLGKLLVTTISQLAKRLHCYKLSLDCRDRLIPFYESLGYQREPGNANSMNIRFESSVEQSRL